MLKVTKYSCFYLLFLTYFLIITEGNVFLHRVVDHQKINRTLLYDKDMQFFSSPNLKLKKGVFFTKING